MRPIKECSLFFIAGVEGSGTTLLLKLLDEIEDFACLGGNFISNNHLKAGEELNRLTTALWASPQPSTQEQSDIISDINAVCVEDPVNSVVYKRSYPFSGSNLIPDLADTQKMGRQTKIILIRRHFFDNVNSILRRDFEKNMDDALSRIVLGYRKLYKQINTLISSGHQLLILDYHRLIDSDSRQSELTLLAKYVDAPPHIIDTWISMISPPNQIPDLVQRND